MKQVCKLKKKSYPHVDVNRSICVAFISKELNNWTSIRATIHSSATCGVINMGNIVKWYKNVLCYVSFSGNIA